MRIVGGPDQLAPGTSGPVRLRWRTPLPLLPGDRVVLRTELQELPGLKDSNKVNLVDRVGAKATTTVETLILPDPLEPYEPAQ